MNKRQIKKIVSHTRKPIRGRYDKVEQILRGECPELKVDIDVAEQILQGDDTHPDILQALGLELLAEIKRLHIDMYMFTSMFKLTKEEEE